MRSITMKGTFGIRVMIFNTMNNIKHKAKRNSILIGSTFVITSLLICFFKGFPWYHPLCIIFIPLWSLGIFWIVHSLSKKFYTKKEMFFPEEPRVESPEYAVRMRHWKKYLLQKASKFLRAFALANAIMFVIKMINYLDGKPGMHGMIFFSITTFLAFIVGKFIEIRFSLKDDEEPSEY